MNQLLGHCAQKQKVMEERLQEFVEERMEWGTGFGYQDRNVRLVFNTYLKHEDFRVDADVLAHLLQKDAEEKQQA